MKLNKETAITILRYALTAVGAYLIGKNFFGNPIDDSIWQGIAGSILAVIGIVWSIRDKTATIEQIQSSLRSVIVFFGSALVGSGIIKEEIVNALVEIVALVIPLVYSETSKAKSRALNTGKISIDELKK